MGLVKKRTQAEYPEGKNNNLDSVGALSHEISLPEGCGRSKKILKYQKGAVRQGAR